MLLFLFCFFNLMAYNANSPFLIFAVKKREGIQGSFSDPAGREYVHSKNQTYQGDLVFEFHQPGRVI